MYKQSGLLVIAALVIATMGILAPTTTVTAIVPAPDVTAAVPTITTLTPSKTRDNAYVWITLTVSNPKDSENIRYVLMQDVSEAPTDYFAGGIFGENIIENIDNIAENLKMAGADLTHVADNLKLLSENLEVVGNLIKEAADWTNKAGENLKEAPTLDNIYNAGVALVDAASDLTAAGDAFKADNFQQAGDSLSSAAADIYTAGTRLALMGTLDLEEAADQLHNAATTLGEAVDENIRLSILDLASDNENGLRLVAFGICRAAENLIELSGTEPENITTNEAGNNLENAYIALYNAAENLENASQNIVDTGKALLEVENTFLENADNFPLRSAANNDGSDNPVVDETTYENTSFLENIRAAGRALDNSFPDNTTEGPSFIENIFAAGAALENAGEEQTVWLGTLLASNIIGYDGETSKTTVRYWLAEAGACMKAADNIDLAAAASCFENAGSRLTAAGDKIDEIVSGTTTLTPSSGWIAETVYHGLLFTSLENHILPSTTDTPTEQTFKFLWQAPDISTAEDHTIRVWAKNPDNSALGTQTDFTVAVDGEMPKFKMKIVQDNVVNYLGVSVDNLIGQVYGSPRLVITAEEAITAFGTIRIENWKVGEENKSLTWTDFTIENDNTAFTYTFTTDGWLENAENIYVVIEAPCATDAFDIENDEAASMFAWIDLIDPVIQDNGLTQFLDFTDTLKPGTDNQYHLTNQKRWTIIVNAEDNDNRSQGDPFIAEAKWAMTTIYVNDVAYTPVRLDNYDVSLTENLQEGVNTIRISTKDRVGLSVENSIDNVFIDNELPTVASVSVAGRTWSDNTLTITDNKPTIRLKISDNGWGIPWLDNDHNILQVYLDNDADFGNGYTENLVHSGEWDNGLGTETYNFENTYDNDNKGLESGAWYIIVVASDNVPGRENDNWVQYFTIDVSAPSAPASVAGSSATGSAATTAVTITTTSISITGTAEAESTVKVYKTTDNGVTWVVDTSTAATATAAADGTWTVTVSVTEGQITGIRVTCTDTAGNESTATLLGYVLADSTSPTVTITSPTTGYSTTDTSISVTGTVGKDTWESWGGLTMTVQVGTSAVTVPLTTSAFSTSVDLSLGTNTIIITVDDGVNTAGAASVTVTRTAAVAAPSPQATEYASYAIVLVIVALVLAAIAIFRKK